MLEKKRLVYKSILKRRRRRNEQKRKCSGEFPR